MPKDYSEILIKDKSDSKVFDKLLDILILEFKAEIIDNLIGLDAQYCDFKIGDNILTLHQETFIGITLYPKALNYATVAENILVEQIGYKLKHSVADNEI